MARSGPIPPLADRIGLWPARVVWASLPVTVAPALDAWLGDVGSPAGWIAAVAGWIIWFAGLLTLAVPSTVALTALRILAPLVPAAAFAAFADAGITTSTIVAAVVAAAVMVAVFQPVTGDAMVNGSAYGSERRLALRPPAALLLGPLQVTWLLTTGPLVAGVVLLAAQRWVPGVLVTIVGIATAALGARSLHQLARRWLVFVPAGVVLHDRAALVEPILLKRTAIARLGPAPADTDTTDLTGSALGLALRAEFRDPVELLRRGGDRPTPTPVDGVLFTPSLPGRVLTEARIRGIKIA